MQPEEPMTRKLLLSFALLLALSTNALAEGFSMTEWSARGLGLAGGMVGRADDASAIAYNAAGITQLPGTHIMGGFATITPYGEINGINASRSHTSAVKVATWTPPHAYITHQLNDNVWLGFGVFTRFGLGNSYAGDWFGRYNMYDVGLQTISAVPTVAYKINDMLSVSLGLEVMYMHMYEGIKMAIPNVPGLIAGGDNDLQLEGHGVGFGVHAGLHAKFNEQWSAGLAYKSQVTQNIKGDAQFSRQFKTPLPGALGALNAMQNSDVNGTMQLPDSVAFGITYKPIDTLSFEVGTVWTRWSTYNHLNIYFDQPSGIRALSDKQWRDGWNFNASVEYKALDWLTLRAGYWYETPVINKDYADYMVPSNGRDVLSLGAGFKWENWTLDLAYAHIWIHALDYSSSRANGVNFNNGAPVAMRGDSSGNSHADLFAVSIGYSF